MTDRESRYRSLKELPGIRPLKPTAVRGDSNTVVFPGSVGLFSKFRSRVEAANTYVTSPPPTNPTSLPKPSLLHLLSSSPWSFSSIQCLSLFTVESCSKMYLPWSPTVSLSVSLSMSLSFSVSLSPPSFYLSLSLSQREGQRKIERRGKRVSLPLFLSISFSLALYLWIPLKI